MTVQISDDSITADLFSQMEWYKTTLRHQTQASLCSVYDASYQQVTWYHARINQKWDSPSKSSHNAEIQYPWITKPINLKFLQNVKITKTYLTVEYYDVITIPRCQMTPQLSM